MGKCAGGVRTFLPTNMVAAIQMNGNFLNFEHLSTTLAFIGITT